jgi:hypothetical protein
MVQAKSVLWSCAAILPLLGFGAWYGTSSGSWSGCCDIAAAGLTTSVAQAKVAIDCCPDGRCCPECCTPSCCQQVKVAAANETRSSDSDCCSDASCCTITATNTVAAFVCPLTGQELPCPNCCPLNGTK